MVCGEAEELRLGEELASKNELPAAATGRPRRFLEPEQLVRQAQ